MTDLEERDRSAARLEAAREGLRSSAARTAAVWAGVLQQTTESAPREHPEPTTPRFDVRQALANWLRRLAAALGAWRK